MYIVIGGTGFLGSYIVSELKRKTKEDIVTSSRTIGGEHKAHKM